MFDEEVDEDEVNDIEKSKESSKNKQNLHLKRVWDGFR
jgi:hypothetical protein